MSILYISNYGDINSGWAIAAQSYIRALSKFTRVVPQRIMYAPQNPPEDILKMEKNPEKCKICIQHVLPNNMVYDGRFYNIGLCFTETSSLGITGWAQKLNLMDEVWVPCTYSAQVLKDSGVTVPIRVFPIPLNPQEMFSAQDFNLKQQVGHDFLFYTIGDFTRRKNLQALLKAFYIEFNGEAGLVIKTNVEQKKVEEFCANIKKGLKIRGEETIIAGYSSRQQIFSIHKSCDVFVCPSYGEAWSIPTHEAMCAGKTPIVTNFSSFPDYISNDNGWLVDYELEPCFGAETFDDLHTAYEEWASVKVNHLRECMREAFENNLVRKTKSIKCMKKALELSPEKIGQQMYDTIRDKA